MDIHGSPRARRLAALLVGSALVVAGAGVASARITSGPPWVAALEDVAEEVTAVTEEVAEVVDPAEVAAVETYFGAFAEGCGTDLLSGADLTVATSVEGLGLLIEALDGGRTSHGVQGIRSVLANCEDHANDGLRNALYHHGLNWIRHYEHELWLQEKFAAKWPDGKPGNGHSEPTSETAETDSTGRPEKPEKVHGNPHTATDSGSHGNGNANGHSR